MRELPRLSLSSPPPPPPPRGSMPFWSTSTPVHMQEFVMNLMPQNCSHQCTFTVFPAKKLQSFQHNITETQTDVFQLLGGQTFWTKTCLRCCCGNHLCCYGNLPGVGGVDPREFGDLEFRRVSMFEEELVLLKRQKHRTFTYLFKTRFMQHKANKTDSVNQDGKGFPSSVWFLFATCILSEP